ncbi:MAG TPA: hypothetical protein P5081_15220 [Phycisphaerae bacterium]|nr:hypothetical protein [Phycisphaerae bacterium]HRW54221.1 hypothetical protein [Phycisphaerae bacterium]
MNTRHRPFSPLTPYRLRLTLAIAAAAAALSGCQQPVRPTDPTMADLPPDTTPADLWDRALTVLNEHGFTPDSQDRANGRITTAPTTSKQWHEPWRKDVEDRYDVMMASLHTIRRDATVQFIHDGARWRADVVVRIYQLSEPEPQITTASSALHGFTGALPDSQGRRSDGQRRWRNMGRDGAMESVILGEILR